MNAVAQKARSFLVEEAGPTATEYAAMLALLIVALISTLATLRDGWISLYTTIGAAVGV